MITIRTTHYSKKELMMLDEIFSNEIINLNKYCGLKCEECNHRKICEDITRVHLYLRRKLTDWEN